MRSSPRQGRRRDGASDALSVLGDVLLVLATLAVAGLVTYLVLYPPGVIDPASQQVPLTTAPATETAPAAAPPPAPAPAPPPDAGAPGQLSLGTACGAVSPLLDRADDTRKVARDDFGALDSETISALTRDLQTLSDISPEELSTLIDPLTAVLVALNNAVLAGDENPELDTEAAETSTEAIRVLCQT